MRDREKIREEKKKRKMRRSEGDRQTARAVDI